MVKKLLVVDDDTIFRRLLIEILTSQGFEVAEARDGEEGLAVFKKTNPDLVITDIRMPKKNGFQLAEEIRTLSPMIPIIFISGWYDPGKITLGKELGSSLMRNNSPNTHFLKKPFRISQLISLIENATFTARANVA
jgi:CheY-like chemotaxis protein